MYVCVCGLAIFFLGLLKHAGGEVVDTYDTGAEKAVDLCITNVQYSKRALQAEELHTTV